ncbi:MAG: hypothetical protein AAGF95_31895, partial [Chloroflexota bacterium]
VADHQVRVFTGITLRIRLTYGLGIRRAWRIANLVHRHTTAVPPKSTARRKFFQRSGLAAVGTLLGLGLGKAGATPVEESNLFATTHLAPTNPTIQKLQSAQAVQAVQQQFGELNWQQAYQIIYQDTGDIGFLVLLQPSSDHDQSTTFLTFGDPNTGLDGQGVVGRTTAQGDELRIDWFTPDGQPLGAIQSEKGHFTPVTDEVSPDFSSSCFIRCLGRNVSASCLRSCVGCAVSFRPVISLDCIRCSACAGSSALRCIRRCD